jgi:indole-3-glycerol phosphate synthase
MSKLDEILAWKKIENQLLRKLKPVSQLEETPFFNRNCISLTKRIKEKNLPGIIAEFKRRSPSRGTINSISEPTAVALGYEEAGALAASILTDERYFGGSLADLRAVREKVQLPLLRKDFIVDEYQVLEAKANGADLILLIASALTTYEISHLAGLAKALGMEVLFEIHDEAELEKLNPDISLVGVNNRSLHSFEVNIENSMRLAEKIPSQFIKVSESGISSVKHIKTLIDSGFVAFLIGESFMQTPDPAAACKELIIQMKS